MKIKFVLFITLIAFIVVACESSKKCIQQGDYARATYLSAIKLQKKRTNEKEGLVLKEAYPLANKKDMDRINFLNLEGRADRWDEIFQLYLQMKDRQELVKTVLPFQVQGQQINFPIVNYDYEIVQAKNKAAEYFYAHAKQLMKQNDKQSYRQAYDELKKTKNYNPSYLDVDKLMDECHNKGTSYIVLAAANNTQFRLANEFLINLLQQDVANFSSFWTVYHSKNTLSYYDYTININVKIIDVSPEKLTKEISTESRKVRDGWEYVLDNKGNVRKDSLGNDMKVEKFKTIFCDVIEHRQEKICHIEGGVEYIENSSRQIMRTVPISADNVFHYSYYTANGELDALSDKTRNRLNSNPMPFPQNWDMINAAGETLKGVISKVLHDNKGYFN